MRYLSFNSHSLITANVPYEKVLRNSDLDNFACHRRSVWGWVEFAQSEKCLHVFPCSVLVTLSSRGTSHGPGFVETWNAMTVLARAYTECVCLQFCSCSWHGGSRDTMSADRQTLH